MADKWAEWFYDSALQSTYALAQGSVRMKREWGLDYGKTIFVIDNGKGRWSSPKQNLISMGKRAFSRLSNQEYKGKIWEIYRKDIAKLETDYVDIEHAQLSSLDDKSLLALYLKLSDDYFQLWGDSIFVDSIPIVGDMVLMNALFGGSQVDAKKSELLSKLLMPSHKSFLASEQEEREEIANSMPQKMMKIPFSQLPISLKKRLEAHSMKWFWVQNNSLNTRILTAEDFWDMIASESDETRAKGKISPLKKEGKLKLLKKMGIPAANYSYIDIMDEFGYFQDIRKKYWIKSMHYFDLLLKEIAKRSRYSLRSLKNAFPWEIVGIMRKNRGAEERDLLERLHFSLTIFQKERPEVFVGRKAREKYREIYGNEEIGEECIEIHGLCASSGKAIGMAKIVSSASELDKISANDILIAAATDPEYVVAMKKAAAIVTEEGGITSHAAIVSRELGVPCLVGVKKATKIFKDGELVEVDANHGVIRRLQK